MKNQSMNENKSIIDYSGKALISSCVAQCIVYFTIKNQPLGLCRFATFYLSGLLGYFIFMGFMKRLDKESYWTGSDVSGGFAAPLLSVWGVVLLDMIFGFG